MPAPLIAGLSATETALLTTANRANQAAGGLGLFNNALGRTVQLIDPGLWVFLERVMLDLQGSIGHLVAPGFEFLGRILRKVADVTISLLPSAERWWNVIEKGVVKVIDVVDKSGRAFVLFTDVLTRLIETIFNYTDKIQPLLVTLDALATTIEFVTQVVTWAALIFDDLGNMIKVVFTDIDNLGKTLERMDATDYWANAGKAIAKSLEDSMGIGGRKASYTGFEEFGKQARISAFQLGRGTRTPEQIAEDQLGELKRLNLTQVQLKQIQEEEANLLRQRQAIGATKDEIVRTGVVQNFVNVW